MWVRRGRNGGKDMMRQRRNPLWQVVPSLFRGSAGTTSDAVPEGTASGRTRTIPPLTAGRTAQPLPTLPPLTGQRDLGPHRPAAGAGARAPQGPGARNGPASPDAEAHTDLRPVTASTSVDIYSQHFGLHARPFALAPDPDFIFWSPAYRRAYTMLEYGIVTHSPITVITGEVGAGKTTLIHHLLRSLGEDVRVGLVSNPHGSRSELLRWVLMALGEAAASDETYVDHYARFQNLLIAEYARGRRVILIFDEAQNLSREALEEIRMFTNINSGKDELLQLVLVGQPELRDIIDRPDMRQFAQRVAASFHLPALDLPTMTDYVRHRLKVAGSSEKVFEKDTLEDIHRLTGGVPRLVNRLCDLALVYACAKERKTVTRATLRQVLDDGAFHMPRADTSPTGS